mmetsp:Transcript_7557/g.14364  ORF Transcript_7557/g.14364 Transcript_7557/m.14364 type:complete len:100 (-) Transcript_7557:8-307(-)
MRCTLSCLCTSSLEVCCVERERVEFQMALCIRVRVAPSGMKWSKAVTKPATIETGCCKLKDWPPLGLRCVPTCHEATRWMLALRGCLVGGAHTEGARCN